jgi:predicted DCC family thiol-disulfide oxidoreductase YuxK
MQSNYTDRPQAFHLEEHSSEKTVLFFDGVCVFCSGFANFVLRNDTRKQIKLCAAQSPLGQKVYRQLGLATEEFETNIFWHQGTAYYKSDAFIKAMMVMGGWRSIVAPMLLCPRTIRNWVYNPIARNRYKWFGRTERCYVPKVEDRGRFFG